MDEQNLIREDFFRGLTEVAKQISRQTTRKGDEGAPGYGVAFKAMLSNYPWVYVDFGYSGELDFKLLQAAEILVQEYCILKQGSYLNAVIGKKSIRFRLLFREDLAQKKRAASESGSP